MFKIVCCFLVALVASTANAKPVDDVICRSPIDMGIVLDSSVSIAVSDFNKAKKFLQDFLGGFKIGPDDTRVSIITYARGVYSQDSFNLTTYNTTDDVVTAMGNVKHRRGPYTATGEGIKFMSTYQLAPELRRVDADIIGLVITDGNSQETTKTANMAKIARESGIEMFALGIGDGIDLTELTNIAGDLKRVIQVKSFNDLESIKVQLTDKTCVTPPPSAACGEKNPADIYFAFNPAELGMKGVRDAYDFMKQTIDHVEMNEGFKFGLEIDCGSYETFNLKDITDINEKGLLNQPDNSGIFQILKGGAYDEPSGGRKNVTDIAVLIVSGQKGQKQKLVDQVQKLNSEGIKVYIADQSNSGTQIDGATTINGKVHQTFVDEMCPS